MAARSVIISFTNETVQTLQKLSAGLSHGTWTTEPPQSIPQGTSTWESESDGIATGTEGEVNYLIPGKSTSQRTVHLHWDNPFVGDNSYDELAPDGFEITHSDGSGDNAQVFWHFAGTGTGGAAITEALMISGYAWEAGKAKQVVFTTADGHIHELVVAVGGKWSHADLTAITGAPTAASVVNGYAWAAGEAKQVVFTTADGHIHELAVAVGGKWSHADLTAIATAPTAASVVNGYAWEAGKAKQVVFTTADGHIHELVVTVGGKWSHADLTAIATAPSAASVVNGYAWEAGKAKQVVFKTADGHIRELVVTVGGKWSHADLTAIATAPAAVSEVNGYAWEAGKAKQVVFTTADGHIHELVATVGGKWSHADLTAIAATPAAASVIDGYAWEAGKAKQVVFTTADGHIHELVVTVGGKWSHADLTAITAAPAAASVVNGYAWEADKAKQVVFTTADGHVHELAVVVGGKWATLT